MLVEITSTESAPIDYREKWAAYSRIPSLRMYLIVEQDRRRVDRSIRLESGTWLHGVDAGDAVFNLICPSIMHLFLNEIYDGVDVT